MAAVGREAEGLVMIVEDHVPLAKSLALALARPALWRGWPGRLVDNGTLYRYAAGGT